MSAQKWPHPARCRAIYFLNHYQLLSFLCLRCSLGTIPGGRTKREKRSKKKNTPTIISGQNSIQNYLTKPKTKTMLKKEDDTHIEHQQLQQKSEYSPGISAETKKIREKPEAIHSPTNATKQHNNYSDQGYSIPETSL